MANLAASSLENNCQLSAKPVSQDCPVSTAIEVIGGKWKVIILYQLRGKTLRFGELKALIPKITQKTLTQQLRDLEKDKLVERTVYAEVPPRVEYTPTELAEQLNPALDLLCAWGGKYQAAHGESWPRKN